MPRSKGSPFSTVLAVGSIALAYRRATRSDAAARARLRQQPVTSELLEANDPRGLDRDAEKPTEVPARGWWAITKRKASKFGENELMSEAASVAFCALLSLVPAITARVSPYGLVADPSKVAG